MKRIKKNIFLTSFVFSFCLIAGFIVILLTSKVEAFRPPIALLPQLIQGYGPSARGIYPEVITAGTLNGGVSFAAEVDISGWDRVSFVIEYTRGATGSATNIGLICNFGFVTGVLGGGRTSTSAGAGVWNTDITNIVTPVTVSVTIRITLIDLTEPIMSCDFTGAGASAVAGDDLIDVNIIGGSNN